MLSLKHSYRFKKSLLCATAVGFWVVAFFILSLYPTFVSNTTFADDEYPVTPTISISSDGILNFDLHPGEFNSGSQEITVNTSNYTGYSLTISAEGSTDLINTENSQKSIPSISLETGQQSKTSSQFNSTSYGISTNGTDYKPVVNGGTIKTTELAGSDTFNLTFGAKVYTDTPSGDYRKVFTLTAVANDALYAISYDKNTEDDVANMPDPNPQPGTTSGSSVNLSTAVPTRARYDFLGWDTNPNATTPTYSAGDSFSLDGGTTNETTLYAIWQHSSETFTLEYDVNGGTGEIASVSNTNRDGEYTFTITDEVPTRTYYQLLGWSTISTAYRPEYQAGGTISRFTPGTTKLYAIWGYAENTLQGWNKCSELETGASVSLIDARDGESYTVRKLADDNCWMVDNLRLDFSNLVEEISYNNTNNPDRDFIDEMNAAPASSNDFSNGTEDELRYNTSNIGDDTLDADGHTYDEYGVYYNWHTATAGNGTTNTTAGDAGGDICPKGFHLPSGSNQGEFYTMNYAINGSNQTDATASARLRDATNNFVFSGQRTGSGSSVVNQGTNGYYWSSTAFGVNPAYALTLAGNTVAPGTENDNKFYGRTIRCVSGTQYALRYETRGSKIAFNMELAKSEESSHVFTISSTEPRKTGYYFLGWTTDSEGTAPEYQAGDTITVYSTSTTLYALWREETNIIPAQEFKCSSLENVGDMAFVRDIRDNSVYTVNKLADGQCWMTDNFRLDFSNLTQPISTANTNNPTSAFITSANANPLSSSLFQLSNQGTINYSTAHIGSTVVSSTGHTYDNYGVYYNWYTATAGNGTDEVTSGEAGGDLCPKGWHLPTGNQNGDFYNLNFALNGANRTDNVASALLRNSLNNFMFSGEFDGTYPTYVDVAGNYWSSTASSATNTYSINIAPNTVSPGNTTAGKYIGRTIRCIAGTEFILRYDANGGSTTPAMETKSTEDDTYTFALYEYNLRRSGYRFLGWSEDPEATVADYAPGETYTTSSTSTTLYAVWEEANILPIASFQCSSLENVGDTAFVRDPRDNSVYTVNKLADGQCWMTENLRLDFANLVEPISASNTNNPTQDFITASSSATSASQWCTNSNDATCTDQILYNTSNIGLTQVIDQDNHSYDEYGVYYNWYTATAGNGTSEVTSGEAGGDLCPKGWHLPAGGASGDFASLTTAIHGSMRTDATASQSFRNMLNNFMLSGRYYNQNSSNRNSQGSYWSSTASAANSAYRLGVDTRGLSIGTATLTKVNGQTIRCIADP